MKKGFTLIELLAVIVILAVIALITVPMILNVVEESREAAFKDSMYSAFNAVEYYVLEKGLGDVPESGIEAEFLNLKNNSFTSGRFVKNIDGNLIAEFVSDGRYCATGSLTNLNVSKGECEINAPSVVIAINGKEATITLTDDNGIVAYALTTSSEEPTEWLNVVETTSITETKTAESAGTYYVHVKNKYGKITTKEYVIEQNAFCAYQSGDVVGTFEYTGSSEEFIVPCSGTYKLEVWGAQGGSMNGAKSLSGGAGGYSSGNREFSSGDPIFVTVGSAGSNINVPTSGNTAWAYRTAGGGRATYFTTTNNTLSELESETSAILIVAGGGGGAGGYGSYTGFRNSSSGGAGGGISGDSSGQNSGANQTSGSGFGTINSSGGQGYYSGYYSNFDYGGGGGSGYIGGVTDGTTENGVRSGNGYAQITLVAID